MIKVSDYIAQFFVEHGMKHIFSISGAGNVHLLKSIIDNGKLFAHGTHSNLLKTSDIYNNLYKKSIT